MIKVNNFYAFFILYYVLHRNSVSMYGTSCATGHTCPFNECVNTSRHLGLPPQICICRRIHEYNGSSWKPGYEKCTDGFQPLSLSPYENGTVVYFVSSYFYRLYITFLYSTFLAFTFSIIDHNNQHYRTKCQIQGKKKLVFNMTFCHLSNHHGGNFFLSLNFSLSLKIIKHTYLNFNELK